MKQVQLGGLTVSAQGLGCMGMSSVYGDADWDESTATIRRAVDLGVTHIDTANAYGQGHNEVLVGRAVAGRRDHVTLATKAGMDFTTARGKVVINNHPDHIKAAADASLLRLGTDHIDLYYLHRVDPEVPLEESIGAMADLVTEGKVRHLGLSEVTGEQLRTAHAVHPIAAVQSEYSLWTRDPETTVADAARELGVGLVAYSPLGRGFLTGTVDASSLAANDGRRRLARFTEEAATANQAVAEAVRKIAEVKGVTAGQIAIAWVVAQGERLGTPVVPIPGTKRVKWLEQNAAALDVELTPDDLAALDALAAQVVGARY
ncbi:aldo/keto reductase [Streptomyces nodosus]|uniref:Aldo/keto reductase n=1 Tax=Streptomyces nodosus TaxID=40318 RepID=A0A0B5DSN1_9ACTN|nr:aldo/keto reductase [Streptomyces nodosus]AJE44300.1 aldo/keto reductase [Streptomyces nodosus]MBB4795927.1 aryl-alcohol dehydrogenase-like predicted oxidoreductase [Streptomyces nodosus]QEV42792.1 aldo/keto reductase [Streptomyces nodosus]